MTAFSGKVSPHVDRHAEARIAQALTEARIVALVGPRQAGKTTLAHRIAADQEGRDFVSLDDQDDRRLAVDDQRSFVDRHRFAAIDEIQRVPDLALALKKSVDEDPRPGRYLITGSVDFFKSGIAPDSLAGRVAMIRLLPFSQSEIGGTGVAPFLARAFAADFPVGMQVGAADDLCERIVAGGYPGALAAASAPSRQAWLGDYARLLASRDMPDLFGPFRSGHALARLLEHCAANAGGLVNLSVLARRLGVTYNTVDRWLAMLEHMFVVQRIPAWHSNRIRHLIRAPKLHFLDSGLLAWLRRVNVTRLVADHQQLGPLLESFVHSELGKAVSHLADDLYISHYRDKNGNEVDFVVEDFSGQVVGIEVKASSSASAGDFRGLRRLADVVGDRFACGIVLHDGERVRQVGARLFAMPVAMLWEDPAASLGGTAP